QAGLLEEDGPLRGKLDQDGQHGEEPTEDERDHQEREDDIKAPLQQAVSLAVQGFVAQAAHRHSPMEGEVRGLYHRNEAIGTGDHTEADGIPLAELHELGDLLPITAWQRAV